MTRNHTRTLALLTALVALLAVREPAMGLGCVCLLSFCTATAAAAPGKGVGDEEA